ncbi:MAG: cobalamin biosynthesis protein CbiX [Gemmataceae bacterium]|nr:cobalamin biosynthesis protein CbiX [Gemmataceae bacterium]
MPLKTALLLIAHGSRQEEANADLHGVGGGMRGLGRYEVVEAAFLELAEPTVEQGAAVCVSAGAARVILLPYFLSAGVHVRRDLAALRSRLAEEHPGVEFCLAEPLGPHPLLLEIVAERARQAEQGDAIQLPGAKPCQPGS